MVWLLSLGGIQVADFLTWLLEINGWLPTNATLVGSCVGGSSTAEEEIDFESEEENEENHENNGIFTEGEQWNWHQSWYQTWDSWNDEDMWEDWHDSWQDWRLQRKNWWWWTPT